MCDNNEQPKLLNHNFGKTEKQNFVKICLSLLMIGQLPVNYHALQENRLKWKTLLAPHLRSSDNFLWFPTYLAKDEAVLRNSMLVLNYNNSCRFTIETVLKLAIMATSLIRTFYFEHVVALNDKN